jgi:CO/xanthine dehydrogenase FAD-binding subunit
MGAYFRPAEIPNALELLARQPLMVVAGGTDFYPARVGKSLDEDILDVSALVGLKQIQETEQEFRIGARVTWSDVIRTDLPSYFDGLKQAAVTVGGVQTQNAGTLCGNICNASPAADSVPNLLALNTQVELSSTSGIRTLPLYEFMLGNRQTARSPEELVTGLIIPKPSGQARSSFEKLGARRYLVISIVMVGAVMALDEHGRITDLRVAVGACSPVAKRLSQLEQDMLGKSVAELRVTPEHCVGLSPINDVRARASYRNEVVPILVQRAILKLTEQSET